MSFGKKWAGRIYGTNTGNIFARIDGEPSALHGSLHINDAQFGIAVYEVSGSIQNETLRLRGRPRGSEEDTAADSFAATGKLNSKGQLIGDWLTHDGLTGTFILFPHDEPSEPAPNSDQIPEQVYVARHEFGAVELGRDDIVQIADEMQKEFRDGKLIVTVTTETEQSRYLDDFKNSPSQKRKAKILKLFVQQSDSSGINRVAVVEFGPIFNAASTQSSDESWALGFLERIKKSVKPLERHYATNFKKLGFGINQIILVAAITLLPSLPSLERRSILMAAVLALGYIINLLHRKYLPLASIYLGDRPAGIWSIITPTLISWTVSASAGLVAAVLAAYLGGMLNLAD